MLAWVLVLSLLAFPQQPPPRDATTRTAASGIVRGRVVSAATGAPLHRVRVTLNGPVPNAPSAVTDVRGEFEISDVPPGTYTLTATRAGYLTIQYGQQRPRELGRSIEVRQGTTTEGIAMTLPRGSVIAGRITDETGDAAPGVRVEALEHRFIRGHRVLVPARITTTNDIGEYRLSGLEPGRFRLRASSSDVWETDDGKGTRVFAVTYFPGVVGSDQPQEVTVNLGQGIEGLDFRLVTGNAARVTGVVEDEVGQPIPDQVVNLSDITRTIGGRVLSSGQGAPPVRTDANGTFAFSKLAPGEYLVSTGGADERVSETVILTDGDVRHLRLTPRKPVEVSGRIVTDEGTAPPFVALQFRVEPVPTDPARVLPQWGESGGITVRPDFTFRTTSLEGPHLFRVVGLPLDWMLKSVRIGARDITDVPVQIQRGSADVTGVEIVLSRQGALITGETIALPGTAPQDLAVIAFPENSALWGPGSRFVHATRPDDSGRFSIPRLPPGTYRVIAAPAVTDGQWVDPAFLQSRLRDGVRVELAEGMVETVKIEVGGRR